MNKPQLLSEKDDGWTIWDGRQRLYREAFPYLPGCFDFANLVPAEQASAAGLTRRLLEKGAFQIELIADSSTAPPLTYWYGENRNQERIWGHHPLALGFPLLLFSEEETLNLSPLFLWEIQLEPVPHRSGTWILGRQEEQAVRLNPWLMDWLNCRKGRGLCERVRELHRGLPLSQDRLLDELRSMAKMMNWTGLPEDPVLEPFPGIDQLDELASPGVILWSGVVAPFPRPVPILRSTPSGLLQQEEIHEPEGHEFGLGELDPFQASACFGARHNRLTLIDGPSGSGKTHLLLHLLSNALSNGNKCLVVASSMGSLREVNTRLAGWQLGPFCFLSIHALRDRALLMDMMRAIADAPAPAGEYDEDTFQQVLGKWQREKQKLDEGYQALRRPVFGNYTWAETVGLFLESNAIEGKELLSTQLHIQDFRFTYEEYRELREAVLRSRPLYQRINTLRHPLQELHPDIFLNFDKEDAEAFTKEQLKVFTEKFGRLQKQYISKVNIYADQLTRHYGEWYRSLEQKRKRLLEEIADNVQQYGRDFELTSLISLRLYGAFLSHYRRMLEAKERIYAGYRKLVAHFQDTPYIDFEFAAAHEGRDLPRMRGSLEAFGAALASWHEQLPGLLQEHLDRLSNKTVHPAIHYRGHILELEDRLDLLLAELNRSGLYAKPFENRMLTIPRRRKYLESVMEQMESTRLYLRDFEAFYNWHRYWLQLPGNMQKVIRALIKVKPADWEAAFKSWYLHHCLSQAYHPALPAQGPSLRQFVFNNDKLGNLLPGQILHHWGQRRQEVLRELRRSDRKLYQQLFGRKKMEPEEEESLKKLFEREGAMLTELLPAWLMTPTVAEEVLPREDHFDLVLIEETQELAINQVQTALKAGKRTVLFGNSSWKVLGPDDSLMDCAIRHGAERYFLPEVHHWSPGNVLALTSPAHLSHNAVEGFTARFEQIDGRYDERTQHNEEEAQQIIRLLNEIEKTPQRTYPSIAIVAMTVGQRDLIASYLRDIKQRGLPGADVLHQLDRNGLGVFHLGELAGQRPDVLLLSCTYGVTDWQGQLSDHLQQLNRPAGVALLSLLMSRPAKSIFVINSVPREALENFAEDFDEKGTFLLSNYLNYIYSLHIADADQQQRIIQRIATHFPSSGPPDHSSPFIREVARALQSYIPAGRIHVERMDAHFFLPLLIDPAVVSAPNAVVLPDGFFGRSWVTSYRWEFRQWEHFTEHGYLLVPTWSVNWWKNAPLEAKKLADRINEKTEAADPSR
jgi:hypothetical protein